MWTFLKMRMYLKKWECSGKSRQLQKVKMWLFTIKGGKPSHFQQDHTLFKPWLTAIFQYILRRKYFWIVRILIERQDILKIRDIIILFLQFVTIVTKRCSRIRINKKTRKIEKHNFNGLHLKRPWTTTLCQWKLLCGEEIRPWLR